MTNLVRTRAKAHDAAVHSVRVPQTDNLIAELSRALKRLDLLLTSAVSEAETVYGADSPNSRFRGLVTTRQDAGRYLAKVPLSSSYPKSF